MTDRNEQWRYPGQIVRAACIAGDKLQIELSVHCPVEDYLEGANEILEQLIESPLNTSPNLIRAYMLGHRLQHLLDDIIPRHPQFEEIHRSIAAEQLRIVNHYNEQVALFIDQQEHSKRQGKDTLYSGDSDDSGVVENERRLSETTQQTPKFSTIASPVASFDDESEISPIQPMHEDDGFISMQSSPPGSVNTPHVVLAYRATKLSSNDIANGQSSSEKTVSALKYRARKPSRKYLTAPCSELRSNDLPAFLSVNVKQKLPLSVAEGGSSANVKPNFTPNGAEGQSQKSEEAARVKPILNTKPSANSSEPHISHERSTGRFVDCDPHPSADNIEVTINSSRKEASEKEVMFETDRGVVDAIIYPGGEIPLQTHTRVDQDILLKTSENRLPITEQASESAFIDSNRSYQQPSTPNFPHKTRPLLKSLGADLFSSERKVSSGVNSSVSVNIRAKKPHFSSFDVRLAESKTLIKYDAECQEANSLRMKPLACYESHLDRAARPRLIHAKVTSKEAAGHPHLDRNGRIRRKEMSPEEEPEATSSSAPTTIGGFLSTNVSSTKNSRESPERLEVSQKDSGENCSGVVARGHRNHDSAVRRRPESQDISMDGFIWDIPNTATQWSQEPELAATFPVFEFSHSENQCQATELDDIIRSIAEDTAPTTTRREVGTAPKSKIDCADIMVDKCFPFSPSFTHDGWPLASNNSYESAVEPRKIFSEYDESSSKTKSHSQRNAGMNYQPNSNSSFSFSSNPENSPSTSFNVGYLDSLDLLCVDGINRERSRVLFSQQQCTPFYPCKQRIERYPSSFAPNNDFRTSPKCIVAMRSKEHELSAIPKYIPPSASVFPLSVNTQHSMAKCEESLIDDNPAQNAVTTFKTVFSFCLTHR